MGTGFMRMVTGVVYVVTGPSLVGGFLVFSVLGFWGIYFVYRAFVALPCREGNDWLYGLLMFLLPSMLFWPSGHRQGSLHDCRHRRDGLRRRPALHPAPVRLRGPRCSAWPATAAGPAAHHR